MIFGAHVIVSSNDVAADRAIFQEVLDFHQSTLATAG